ncbi:MAG: citrate lyase acyl carrier protein [Synergistaceae bacterium]|jgi:citrate lyase subunit gamma (acyl carrier protein)|nr:citrate lyase acyl carrier protein [Synergistaceae bacterium]
MTIRDNARTAQAGTLESMDCLVTVTESTGERQIEISGAAVSRFAGAMTKKVNQVLDELEGKTEAKSVVVSVQDNGALDIVLGARVEAAYLRLVGGGAS